MDEPSLLEALGSPDLERLPPFAGSPDGPAAAIASAVFSERPGATPPSAPPPPSGRLPAPQAAPAADGSS